MMICWNNEPVSKPKKFNSSQKIFPLNILKSKPLPYIQPFSWNFTIHGVNVDRQEPIYRTLQKSLGNKHNFILHILHTEKLIWQNTLTNPGLAISTHFTTKISKHRLCFKTWTTLSSFTFQKLLKKLCHPWN